MKLVIISGRSGSGKSTALHALEDSGYSCIDNFPAGLLPALVRNGVGQGDQKTQLIAVSIDARNSIADIKRFPEILRSLEHQDLETEIMYLDAVSPTLVKRFSETRRRHPLTSADTDLREAIEAEREILSNIADLADLFIDTSQLDHTGLSDLINARVVSRTTPGLSLLFRSFGYKFGVPVDSDLVFDIRCLVNPHWVTELRPLTGLDEPVRRYLDGDHDVHAMHRDISRYLERWLPMFQDKHRIYLTVSIGCTGGKHRSVYMAEQLARHFSTRFANVLVRHRELETRRA